MNSRPKSVVEEQFEHHSRYLLVLALAVVLALGVGATAPAFAAQEKPEPPVDGQIVGGTPVPDGKYPFAAKLDITNDEGTFLCGGSLIDQSHVLTAAHCVVGAQTTKAVIGRTDLNNTALGVERNVTEFTVHPNFNPNQSYAYDVAVLELDAPVTNIQPIALAQPKTGANKPKNKATVVGYGRTSEGGTVSDRLLEAQVPIVSDKSCKADYAGQEAILKVFPKLMLCAGKKGVDSCQGDSGGPLFRAINGELRQTGIVSFGKGCARAKFPGVYTQITAEPILSFIQQATGAATVEEPAAA